MGILAAVMRVLEESEEHRTLLHQAPLSEHAGEYLRALSMAMTEKGAVELDEAGEATRGDVDYCANRSVTVP